MIVRFLLAAICAGLLAGLLITPVQYARLIPLILHAEVYERGGDAHDHAALAGAALIASAQAHEHGESAGDADASQAPPMAGRLFGTILANLVTGAGFALILSATSLAVGVPISRSNGVVWGLAGFAVASLAPALGLAPELPAMPAADLYARQIWWIATVLLSAGGLYMLVFCRQVGFKAAGIFAILLPHLVGAPQPVDLTSPIPPTLGAEFAVASLATAALFWVLVGRLCGEAHARFGERQAVSGAISA